MPVMLKLMTWNVTGIMSSSSYLCNCLTNNNIDICGIGEHWLFPHNLYFLDSLFTDYRVHAVCDNDLSMPSNRRVGKGGVALLWHSRLDNYITPLNLESDRIAGLQVQLSSRQYVFIFQVYLPCSNHGIDSYRKTIDVLYDLWSMFSPNGTVIFMGDFNATFHQSSVISRDKLFYRFVQEHNLCVANCLPLCSGASHTFVSYDNSCQTLIDFICLPSDYTDCITDCIIVDDDCLNVSRHRPVIMQLSLPIYTHVCDDSVTSDNMICWRKAGWPLFQNENA